MHYLFTDGGSRGNPGPSAIGALIFDEDHKLVDFTGKYIHIGTNNKAEYLALLSGVKLLNKIGINEAICCLDSELVVKQIKKEYKIKDAEIRKMVDLIEIELKSFKSITFKHVPRAENHLADKLVNIILDNVNNENSKDI